MKTTKSIPVWAETAEGGEDQAGGGDERRREEKRGVGHGQIPRRSSRVFLFVVVSIE